VRAVSVSDVHVLAQSMLHLSERPRLLVFADNRQDAAFQAGWMRDHARRFRLRALMAQQIPDGGASIGDVVHTLDGILEKDRELSRALLPEVWQVVPFDESGTKHREERLYFLRIQILREIATGVKQRLGLEPWGRLKVSYPGLSAPTSHSCRSGLRSWALPRSLWSRGSLRCWIICAGAACCTTRPSSSRSTGSAGTRRSSTATCRPSRRTQGAPSSRAARTTSLPA
jgi:hypothetical protein